MVRWMYIFDLVGHGVFGEEQVVILTNLLVCECWSQMINVTIVLQNIRWCEIEENLSSQYIPDGRDRCVVVVLVWCTNITTWSDGAWCLL